jgi:hypothetical protein
MAIRRKPEQTPLLGPGYHVMTLDQLKRLTVDGFESPPVRRDLYDKVEQLVQEFLTHKIQCEFWIDGSFLTEDEDPSDVDIAIKINDDVLQTLTHDQNVLVDAVNAGGYIDHLDAFIFSGYYVGHPLHGTDLDLSITWVAGSLSDLYGKGRDHWLKGVAVILVWETALGLQLRARARSATAG